jgi:hypothetical protein
MLLELRGHISCLQTALENSFYEPGEAVAHRSHAEKIYGNQKDPGLADKVTRMGDFSPIGRMFTLSSLF